MNAVSRIISALLVTVLVGLVTASVAVARPDDGLEVRFGSGVESGISSPVHEAARQDGLEVRFGTTDPAPAPAPALLPDQPLADSGTRVTLPVLAAIVVAAIVLASGFGYAAGTARTRRPAHA